MKTNSEWKTSDLIREESRIVRGVNQGYDRRNPQTRQNQCACLGTWKLFGLKAPDMDRMRSERLCQTVRLSHETWVWVNQIQPYTVFRCWCRLEAEISALPPPQVTWYTKGREIKPTEHTRIVQEGNTFTMIITKVTQHDVGEYILRVKNELGEATCKTTLLLKGNIRFFWQVRPEKQILCWCPVLTLYCTIIRCVCMLLYHRER